MYRHVGRPVGAQHDAAAHHAADGALPIALAALSGARGAFYATAGRRARSLEEAAHEVRAPFPRGDPAGWAEETVEAFWARLGEATPGLAEAWAAGSRHEQDKGELCPVMREEKEKKLGWVSGTHLEHLECSWQPHIQGRGAKKRTQRAG